MAGHVFVCYSRRQFHAARQLVAVLGEQGLDVWFDVERLVPGTDWNATIERAVDDASALVVVGSADAVASPYVAREWQRARERGVPVFVAVVRGTRLPAELRGAPRVDLRRRFEPGARRLADGLRGAAPARTRRWAVWPASVLLVVAALLLNVLAVLGLFAVAALDLDLPVPDAHKEAAAAMGAAVLVYAGWSLRPLWGFCAGRARRVTLTVPMYGVVPLLFLVWGVLGSLISAVNHGSSVINEASISGDLTGPYVLVLLPLLSVNTAALMVLYHSPSVLRWLPAGEGPPRQVAALDARRSPAPPRPAVEIRTFTVHHADADAVIAAQVTTAFRSAGAKYVSDGADLHLAVISNATTWEDAAGWLRAGPSVAVLACGVRLPDEAADMRSVQWLDFRDGRVDRLRDAAMSLIGPGERHTPGPSPSPAAVQASPSPAWATRSPGAVAVRATPTPRAADAFDAPRAAKVTLECLVAAATVFALSAVFTASLAPPSEERVHSTARPVVPNPPPIPTRTQWRPLLDCGPGPLPATPGALPCRFVVPSDPPTSARPAFIPNPDYPALPGSADTVLRVRAWLAVVLAVLAVGLAYRLGRRALRRNTFESGMLALFALAGLWGLLGVVELKPQRLLWYAAIWIAGAVGLLKRSSDITEWLPGDERPPRRHLRAVAAGLLRPTLPVVLLLLAVWYAGGVVL